MAPPTPPTPAPPDEPAVDGADAVVQWAALATARVDASHDHVHAANVARLSEEIVRAHLPGTGAELRAAIRVLAWTHDLCDRKYVPDKPAAIAAVAERCTAAGLQPRVVGVVTAVLEHLSFTARLQRTTPGGEPEALSGEALLAYRVVSDADMLEAMGMTGVVRTYMFQAVRGASTESALEHICQKLMRCHEYLHYEWSRREGATRQESMHLACESLRAERAPL